MKKLQASEDVTATPAVLSDYRNEFIDKAVKKHGFVYDYSSVIYHNKRTKVQIICATHGEFWQTPGTHLQGRGCPQCGIKRLSGAKYNTEEFIRKAIEIHGTRYDYSITEYDGQSKPIVIICKVHGRFIQKPQHHLAGSGCKACSRGVAKTDISTFITKASIIHNDYYDYSLVDYRSSSDKITIICPVHGQFEQTVPNHLSGKGCRSCGIVVSSTSNSYSTEEFVNRAVARHGPTYDYSASEYSRSNVPLTICCRTHGQFTQLPSEHLRGCGCFKCGTIVSAGHRQIINMLPDIDYLVNDRTTISPYELDIYIPKLSLAIEYHGNRWHSYGRQETVEERAYHSMKHDLAVENNVKLLQVFEYELVRKPDIIRSIVRHHCGLSIPVYARKCSVVELSPTESDEYFDINHIQGQRKNRCTLCLVIDGNIVCALSTITVGGVCEIIRYANTLGFRVIGGAGRLMKSMITRFKPVSILTFADRRFSVGTLYKQLGYTLVGVTKPNYRYISNNGRIILSRHRCQKHRLPKLLGDKFNPDLSESANMFSAGFRRIWDAGNYKFECKL